MPRKLSNKASTHTAKRHTAAPAKAEVPAAIKPVIKQVQATAPSAIPTPATVPALVDNKAEVAALVAKLRGGDADTARDAAIALGALGNRSAVEPLIEAVSDSTRYYHGVVRAGAAASLGRLGDARAVDALLGAVRDSLAEPSAEAIRALAAIGDCRAVGTLIEVVRNPNGFFLPVARRAAVVALAQFKDAKAAAELTAVVDDPNEDADVRQAAIDAGRCD